MNTISSVNVETLATVTVTFNPDIALLEAQLRALPIACLKVIVDNASTPDVVAQIQSVSNRINNVRLLHNDSNIGLAAAVNRGVKAASELPMSPHFVLLLDQDSEPQMGSIEALLEAFQALEAEGQNVGCVGPLLRDPDTGLTHGFHQCTRWRWKRVYPPVGSTTPIPCINLNGSGTLVPVALFQHLGGLDESLFIDHVDTEWAFRVLASGRTLWGIPNAVFLHRMGQASVRFWWFGWRIWPSRLPQRHYYLYRNAAALIRRPYVPHVWKVWAVMKLVMTTGIAMVFDSQRAQHLQNMWRGARDGLTRKERQS